MRGVRWARVRGKVTWQHGFHNKSFRIEDQTDAMFIIAHCHLHVFCDHSCDNSRPRRDNANGQAICELQHPVASVHGNARRIKKIGG